MLKTQVFNYNGKTHMALVDFNLSLMWHIFQVPYVPDNSDGNIDDFIYWLRALGLVRESGYIESAPKMRIRKINPNWRLVAQETKGNPDYRWLYGVLMADAQENKVWLWRDDHTPYTKSPVECLDVKWQGNKPVELDGNPLEFNGVWYVDKW